MCFGKAEGDDGRMSGVLLSRRRRAALEELEFEDNPFNDYSGYGATLAWSLLAQHPPPPPFPLPSGESDHFVSRYMPVLRWFRDHELIRGVGLSP